MLATIGNNVIAKLKPKDKPYDVRDDRLTGFLVRVNVSGKLVYMCEYGRGKRLTLGKAGVLTPMQARDKAREVLADVVNGMDPRAVKKSKNMTLHLFIETEYTQWVQAHRKDAFRTLARIKRCFYGLFGKKPLSDITSILIDQWRIQRIKAGCTAKTVNVDIATFKAALSKAVEWGFIEIHPLKNFKLLKVDNAAKVRYLTEEEEKQLRVVLDNREEKLRAIREQGNNWRRERNYELLPNLQNLHFADHLKPMVILSINTGIRQGELFSLRWEEIDLDKAILSIRGNTAKSYKTRHIPLNKEALNILTQWKKQNENEELIFANKEKRKFNNVRKSWTKLLKIAGIKNFRWHDLRHHFASKLAMLGVDLNTIRELLGHSDIKMTLRYAHLAPEHKAMAVARLVNN
ncbi:MAG TPA: site-specific integrase [Gammaproteobacteria bacterium]|jgi:integrase|nr:site-specific integrase [Gammaproteobacteria bacterium]